MLDLFEFFSYYFTYYPVYTLLFILLFLVSEIIIIKFLKFGEKLLHFLIIGMFLLVAVVEGYGILMPFFATLNILSIFGQYGWAPWLVIFISNLFAALVLLNYKKLSIKKTISLNNAYILLGGLQFAVLFVLSLPDDMFLSTGWFLLYESLLERVTLIHFPSLVILTGIAFHLASAIDKFKIKKAQK